MVRKYCPVCLCLHNLFTPKLADVLTLFSRARFSLWCKNRALHFCAYIVFLFTPKLADVLTLFSRVKRASAFVSLGVKQCPVRLLA